MVYFKLECALYSMGQEICRDLEGIYTQFQTICRNFACTLISRDVQSTDVPPYRDLLQILIVRNETHFTTHFPKSKSPHYAQVCAGMGCGYNWQVYWNALPP